MEQKKDIRRRVLDLRNQISVNEWEEKSRAIYNKVIAHPFFIHAKTVYLYVDYKNEVGTKALIEMAWKLGKKVAVPKIIHDQMSFFYINDFSDLEKGYKGIYEPRTTNLANDKNALIIMPGVAFDYMRHRIGYGKGFYDRFLNCHQHFHTLAICFSCQMVEHILTDEHDICPEVLITEENIYAE